MRRFIYLLPLLGLMLFSHSCKEAVKWGQYTSKEGGFTVYMPSNPKKHEKKVGRQLIHFVTWKPTTFALDKFKLFEVSYTDFPGFETTDSTQMEAFLDMAIGLRKKDFTDLDIESVPISLNGYPGRAFMYQIPRGNTITIVKECIVGQRRYDLTVIAKKDYPTNEEMNAFFNSFTILR